MKFLVIGHSVEDHIISGNNEIIKPGGIYYTASALTFACHPRESGDPMKTANDSVYLCTSAEKENYNLFSDVFDLCKPDFIQYTGTIPKVLLTIHGEKERD